MVWGEVLQGQQICSILHGKSVLHIKELLTLLSKLYLNVSYLSPLLILCF